MSEEVSNFSPSDQGTTLDMAPPANASVQALYYGLLILLKYTGHIHTENRPPGCRHFGAKCTPKNPFISHPRAEQVHRQHAQVRHESGGTSGVFSIHFASQVDA